MERWEIVVASKMETYWAGAAERLILEVRHLSGTVQHNGERGRANEEALKELLARMVPHSVKVKTGEVIDSKGGHSPQSDALITSVARQPSLFAQTEEILHPIETVLLVVEVKSTMTKGEVDDFQRKVRKFREVRESLRGKVSGVAPVTTLESS